MEGIISRLIRDSKPIEKGNYQSPNIFDNFMYRCMDIHMKKLNDIKRANTVKRMDDTKKVDEYLNRRHVDKMRTAEFQKQGIFYNEDYLYRA